MEAIGYFSPAQWVQPSIMMALLSASIFFGVTFSFANSTKRAYFSLWNLAALFYVVTLAASLGLVALPQLLFISQIRASLIGATAVLMFWSSFQLYGKPRNWREMTFAVAVIVLWNHVAVGSLFPDRQTANPWVALPMYILFAVACACTAFTYLKDRKWNRGAKMVASGFVLWGATSLVIPFASASAKLSVAAYVLSAVFLLAASVGLILEQEIGASEEKYRALFDSAKDAIFIVDPWNFEIFDVNKAAQKLTKSEATTLLGSSFLRWCPELAEKGNAKAEQRKFLDALFRPYREFSIIRQFGETLRCEGELKPVQVGERAGLQLTIREVPQRPASNKQPTSDSSFSSLGQLVASVAHELNNPLAAAMGCAQNLAKDSSLQPKAHLEVLRIFNETERAAKILTNVLTFIRPNGPQFVATDLNRIVLSILEHRNHDMAAAHIRLETQLDCDLKRTKADPSQISRALSNLLNNAIQAVEEKPDKKVIRVSTSANGFYVRIAVTDSGEGIAPEAQPKIFDPFFTTRPTGKGTGLGLTVASKIVEDHRGKIWFESKPGHGTTFFVELPIVACEEIALGEIPAPTTGSETGSKSAARQLLLVDDEPGILDALSELLRDVGYNVDTAQNGKDAINRISSKNYDLIMSDLYMPQMDGRHFYESVLEQKPELAKRIVFLTGDAISNSSREFLESTGNRWLCKPFGMQDVEDVVRDVLTNGPTPVQTSAMLRSN